MPQRGGTRHDIMHALEFAAAHSAQREDEWSALLPHRPNAELPRHQHMHELEASTEEASKDAEASATSTADEETAAGLNEGEMVTASDLESEGEESDMHDVDDSAVFTSNHNRTSMEDADSWIIPYGKKSKFTVGTFKSHRVRLLHPLW
jgi:hypothetical protein